MAYSQSSADDTDNDDLPMERDDDYEDSVVDDDDEGEEDGNTGSDGGSEDHGEEEDEENNTINALHDEAELGEMEKGYTDLSHQQRNILSNLKRNRDEDFLKGQAVRNQKALWDRTLEFRFLLQKAFSSSNRLPQEPVRSSFRDSDESVDDAYSDLINSSRKTLDSLLELEEALLEKNPSILPVDSVFVLQALLEKNPSILPATDGKPGRPSKNMQSLMNSDANADDDWSRISELHGRVAAFRDKSVNKWQRKSQVTTGAAAIKSKLQAFNQNISEQVATYMRDPSRMIQQMQLIRSTVGVFGTEANSVNAVQADGDPELLDDSEFYQQLLKEFFETIDPKSNEAAMYALKRLQTKKRKLVDRRASKGRKIRYHVHKDLMNFMAPQPPPNNNSSDLGLFKNLFQSTTTKAE